MTYNPFRRGRFPVGVRTLHTHDTARGGRALSVEVWYPAAAPYAGQAVTAALQDTFEVLPGRSLRQTAVRDAALHPGSYPLIAFSHSSGGHRRQSTFLCTHLASHGYIVAAVDHAGNTTRDTVRMIQQAASGGETPDQRKARLQVWIADRVPDIRFMLDQLLGGAIGELSSCIDPDRIGMTGYSFGGWTARAVTAMDTRIRATMVLAPAASSNPRPGLIPVSTPLDWGRDVPTLFLAAERDTWSPLSEIDALFTKTQATKQMVILNHADHCHFGDRVERVHERARTQLRRGETAWMSSEMPPTDELCPGEHAHLVVRGMGLAHMDAFLKASEASRGFLAGNLETIFAEHGVSVIARISPSNHESAHQRR